MKVDKWTLFDVSRKSVNFTHANGVKDNSNLLAQILPFGYSPGEALKYSSQITKKIENANRGQYDQIKRLLMDFWQIIIQTDEMSSALDFAINNRLHLSDYTRVNNACECFEKDLPQ